MIFITGRNKRAIEDHFDSNQELEAALLAYGKIAQAEIINNILPKGVECIFKRQREQLGLGHAVLCAERAIVKDPFAILLADDFVTDNGLGVTNDLIKSFESSGKTQISVMEVSKADVSKYGIIKPTNVKNGVSGIFEKPQANDAPSNLACIGRYVVTSDIFKILKNQAPGRGR